MITEEQLLNSFSYHRPRESQIPKYEMIRGRALEFAKLIIEMTPVSPEQTLAVRKLEEAVMWANASIARNEK